MIKEILSDSIGYTQSLRCVYFELFFDFFGMQRLSKIKSPPSRTTSNHASASFRNSLPTPRKFLNRIVKENCIRTIHERRSFSTLLKTHNAIKNGMQNVQHFAFPTTTPTPITSTSSLKRGEGTYISSLPFTRWR
jgi:hypothetical protein